MKSQAPIVQPSSTSIRIRLRANESAPQKSTSRWLGSRPFKNYSSNCGIVAIGLTVDAHAADILIDDARLRCRSRRQIRELQHADLQSAPLSE
jgi:hypothetical protein